MIPYVPFDKIAFSLGPLSVHWYGIMYLVGFAAAWYLARRRAAAAQSTWKPLDVDDLLFYGMLGVILGGRLGYVLIYGLDYLRADWRYVYRIWEGGMSFHGGLVGVLVAMTVFARRRGRRIGDVFDFAAPLPGIGLFAGRIGNFINGELWGRETDVPWAFVVDGVPRHATQLYEALLEGAVLFAILWWFTSRPRPRGAAPAVLRIFLGAARSLVEILRLPDA
ncbi:MAG: prolipoprotein diacylglyceryl transferase, partial [Steroidobacteraceae bacterium]|nr:prolipoprotein diacylglyceryl transferase [Steroidobacteraceae bacterium]MDW8258747.1 prolipoprotein diacylglyceryl transferase [Gammaproteobacteria bacterium]